MRILFVFNHPAFYKVKFLNEFGKSVELDAIFERKAAKDRNKIFYEGKATSFKEILIKGINVGRENIISGDVKRYIKHNHNLYDLIIMNGYSNFAEISAIKYMKGHKIPYALYINGGIIPKKECFLKRRFKKKMISGASLYFSPDENSNKYLIYYGADSKKIRNYPYSTIYEKEIIKTPLNQIEKESKREALKIKCEHLFIYSGQFIKRKNVFTLLKLWNKEPDSRFLILCGEGKEKRKYERYIRRHYMSNVIIYPYLNHEDLFKLYQIASGYISLSKEDIYGHVINEALSQGLKVIATSNINSAKHLITSGEEGYIIKLSKYGEKFYEAIDRLIIEGPSEKTIDKAKENTIEKMVDVHLSILSEYLEK